jgi:hypothetical protein
MVLLSIQKITEESILLDASPMSDYYTMEIEENSNGLFNLKKVDGVRFAVALHQPKPGFFFSVADFADDNEYCVIIFNEEKNLIGAYFYNNKK